MHGGISMLFLGFSHREGGHLASRTPRSPAPQHGIPGPAGDLCSSALGPLGSLRTEMGIISEILDEYAAWWWLVAIFGLFSHEYWESHHPNWRTPIFQRGSNHQPDMVQRGFIYPWLVLWLPLIFYFPMNIGNLKISQLTNSNLFQRGGPTTNQIWFN